MIDRKGFTLLELLISITLIAVLVVVLSMALRSGINAYSRSKNYNRFYLPMASLYGLLWRQMEAVVGPSDPALQAYSKFNGRRDALTFTSTYVPQGTSQGGIFQVVYLYDEEGKRIIYAQKVITSRADIEKRVPAEPVKLDKKTLAEKGWIIDEIDNVDEFSFAYKPSDAGPETAPEDWDEKFNRRRLLPQEIAFKLKFKDQDKQEAKWQVIPVGIR